MFLLSPFHAGLDLHFADCSHPLSEDITTKKLYDPDTFRLVSRVIEILYERDAGSYEALVLDIARVVETSGAGARQELAERGLLLHPDKPFFYAALAIACAKQHDVLDSLTWARKVRFKQILRMRSLVSCCADLTGLLCSVQGLTLPVEGGIRALLLSLSSSQAWHHAYHLQHGRHAPTAAQRKERMLEYIVIARDDGNRLINLTPVDRSFEIRRALTRTIFASFVTLGHTFSADLIELKPLYDRLDYLHQSTMLRADKDEAYRTAFLIRDRFSAAMQAWDPVWELRRQADDSVEENLPSFAEGQLPDPTITQCCTDCGRSDVPLVQDCEVKTSSGFIHMCDAASTPTCPEPN